MACLLQSFIMKEHFVTILDCRHRQEEISRVILNYLCENPKAGDTLEGITRWWLEMQRIEFSVNEVEDVLESLVRKSVIRKYKVKDGTTFYKIKGTEIN